MRTKTRSGDGHALYRDRATMHVERQTVSENTSSVFCGDNPPESPTRISTNTASDTLRRAQRCKACLDNHLTMCARRNCNARARMSGRGRINDTLTNAANCKRWPCLIWSPPTPPAPNPHTDHCAGRCKCRRRHSAGDDQVLQYPKAKHCGVSRAQGTELHGETIQMSQPPPANRWSNPWRARFRRVGSDSASEHAPWD